MIFKIVHFLVAFIALLHTFHGAHAGDAPRDSCASGPVIPVSLTFIPARAPVPAVVNGADNTVFVNSVAEAAAAMANMMRPGYEGPTAVGLRLQAGTTMHDLINQYHKLSGTGAGAGSAGEAAVKLYPDGMIPDTGVAYMQGGYNPDAVIPYLEGLYFGPARNFTPEDVNKIIFSNVVTESLVNLDATKKVYGINFWDHAKTAQQLRELMDSVIVASESLDKLRLCRCLRGVLDYFLRVQQHNITLGTLKSGEVRMTHEAFKRPDASDNINSYFEGESKEAKDIQGVINIFTELQRIYVEFLGKFRDNARQIFSRFGIDAEIPLTIIDLPPREGTAEIKFQHILEILEDVKLSVKAKKAQRERLKKALISIGSKDVENYSELYRFLFSRNAHIADLILVAQELKELSRYYIYHPIRGEVVNVEDDAGLEAFKVERAKYLQEIQQKKDPELLAAFEEDSIPKRGGDKGKGRNRGGKEKKGGPRFKRFALVGGESDAGAGEGPDMEGLDDLSDELAGAFLGAIVPEMGTVGPGSGSEKKARREGAYPGIMIPDEEVPYLAGGYNPNAVIPFIDEKFFALARGVTPEKAGENFRSTIETLLAYIEATRGLYNIDFWDPTGNIKIITREEDLKHAGIRSSAEAGKLPQAEKQLRFYYALAGVLDFFLRSTRNNIELQTLKGRLETIGQPLKLVYSSLQEDDTYHILDKNFVARVAAPEIKFGNTAVLETALQVFMELQADYDKFLREFTDACHELFKKFGIDTLPLMISLPPKKGTVEANFAQVLEILDNLKMGSKGRLERVERLKKTLEVIGKANPKSYILLNRFLFSRNAHIADLNQVVQELKELSRYSIYHPIRDEVVNVKDDAGLEAFKVEMAEHLQEVQQKKDAELLAAFAESSNADQGSSGKKKKAKVPKPVPAPSVPLVEEPVVVAPAPAHVSVPAPAPAEAVVDVEGGWVTVAHMPKAPAPAKAQVKGPKGSGGKGKKGSQRPVSTLPDPVPSAPSVPAPVAQVVASEGVSAPAEASPPAAALTAPDPVEKKPLKPSALSAPEFPAPGTTASAPEGAASASSLPPAVAPEPLALAPQQVAAPVPAPVYYDPIVVQNLSGFFSSLKPGFVNTQIYETTGVIDMHVPVSISNGWLCLQINRQVHSFSIADLANPYWDCNQRPLRTPFQGQVVYQTIKILMPWLH